MTGDDGAQRAAGHDGASLHDARQSGVNEICSLCGYPMASLEADAKCPECGGMERVRLDKLPFINARSVEPVLWVQAAGAALCFLAGVLATRLSSAAVGMMLFGAAMCVIVGPLMAMSLIYPESRLARQPPALRRPGAAILFVVVAGCAAVCTGALMGLLACLVSIPSHM